MHHAPAVSYPVGRCRFRTCLIWATALAQVLALGLWTWQQGLHLEQGLGWTLGVALIVALAHMARRAPQGDLHWQEDQWLWVPAQGATQVALHVQVSLDWQSGLLLHFPGQPAHWLWLERAQASARWLDLRRAVWGHSPVENSHSTEIV